MSREHFNTLTRLRAVLSSRTLYELAATLEWERPVGRPPANPTYVVLAYGVLTRLTRSGVRVEQDLGEPATWTYARSLMVEALQRHHIDLPHPGSRPPTWSHWEWLRNRHLATDDGLAQLARAFPPLATAAANRIDLLRADGPGSLTHPDPSRVAYGDGTLVRPLYRPPETVSVDNDDGTTTLAYPDPRTGRLQTHPPGRFDPDLQNHHGRLGPVQTHGYVCWHTRGPRLYQRIVLAADHIPIPGAEASTAVRLLSDVHRAAGAGIQAVVYDGAWRGVHITEVMRRYGYLVLCKMPSADAAGDPHSAPLTVNNAGRRARSYPLGTVSHRLPTGTCSHQLATLAGRVVEIGLDETGDPVVLAHLARGPVKRSRRSHGDFHFNVGYHLNCPLEPFTVWLSPHPRDNQDARRAENLRIIPPGDPDFIRLHGLRSDAESFHSNFKRTLLVDRQMSLGWRRGLVDVYCFALMNNAFAEHRAAETELAQASQTRRPLQAAPG